MSHSKIGVIEAIAFLIVISLNHTILNLPNHIINQCGSSSLLNIIFVAIIFLLFLTFLLRLLKNFTGYDILDISEFLGGKKLKAVIGVLFVSYFLIMSGTQLRNFVSILKITYFERAPECFLIFCLLTIVFLTFYFHRSSIFRGNVIVTALILINLLIIFIGISYRFLPERVFPLLGYGAKQTFLVGLTNLFAFSGFAYLYLLPPFLKKKEDIKKVCYGSFAISFIYLFLSIMSLLFTYADILFTNELSPIFTLAKNLHLTRFIQGAESLFLLGWILGLLSYLSISIMIMTIIFQKMTQASNCKITGYTFITILFIIAIIPKGMTDIRWIQNNVFPWMTNILIYILGPTILILANIKYRKKHKGIVIQEEGEINK